MRTRERVLITLIANFQKVKHISKMTEKNLRRNMVTCFHVSPCKSVLIRPQYKSRFFSFVEKGEKINTYTEMVWVYAWSPTSSPLCCAHFMNFLITFTFPLLSHIPSLPRILWLWVKQTMRRWSSSARSSMRPWERAGQPKSTGWPIMWPKTTAPRATASL